MKALISKLKSLLSHRYLPFILGLLAFIIMIWALDEGFIMDDHFHRAKLLGKLYEGSDGFSDVLHNMFSLNRTPEELTQLKETGFVPWWAADDLKLSNWRPLASLTHWFDYQLFPHSAALMHAHSLLWLSLAVLAVAAFYRRMSGPIWVAGLAGLMYLLDEANSFPTLWIANRNEMIAVAFGATALICHHRARCGGSWKYVIGSVLLFLCSLLATEAGIATFVYLAAYALCLDRSPWRQRLVSLAPAFAVLVLWRVVYSSLGHGTLGCGAIIDPGRTPLAFIQAALVRAPILLMGQLGLAQPDLFGALSPKWQLMMTLVCAGGLALMILLFLPLWRMNRHVRFYGLGMILAVVPICATMPYSRNLMFVAIGGFGFVAHILSALIDISKVQFRGYVWKVAVWVLTVVLLVLAIPVTGLSRLPQPGMTRFITGQLMPSFPWDEMPDSLSDKQVLIVNAANPFGMLYAPLIRMHEGKPLPQNLRVLSPAWGRLEIERSSDTSLVLRSQGDNLFADGSGAPFHVIHMFRMIDEVFYTHWDHVIVGQSRRLGNLEIQVTQTGAYGAPREVVFTLDKPLEDASLVWLEFDWVGYRLQPCTLPQVGKARELGGPGYMSLGQALDDFLKRFF